MQITTQFSDLTTSTGTGFFINKHCVATARHVITAPAAKTVQRIFVCFRVPSFQSGGLNLITSFSCAPAEVIATDKPHDIALLSIKKDDFALSMLLGSEPKKLPGKTASVVLETRTLRDGEPIFISGYPLAYPVLITTSGIVASSEPFSIDVHSGKLNDSYLSSLQVNPGNSGGPVFSSATRSVIGLCVAYQPVPVKFADSDQENASTIEILPNNTLRSRPIAVNSGIAVIVPVRYLEDLLTQNKLDFSINQPKPADDATKTTKQKQKVPLVTTP